MAKPAKKVEKRVLDRNQWTIKWRPQELDDVIGQDPIVAAIRGMFVRGSVSSSYLIVGPSGNGKTTIARILANMLNSLPEGTREHVDIQEINAADERGIDAARELVRSLAYVPQRARFRIFIIDEAHNFTKDASTQLLKPLEEPPAHVIWIFCTNEPQKLLETIRRRCYILAVQQTQPSDTVKILRKIARAEKVFQPFEDYKKLYQAVAEAAGGQPAGAINILQRLADVNAATKISEKNLDDVLQSAMATLDLGAEKVAVKILLGLYKGSPGALKSLGDTKDMKQLSYFLLDLNSFHIEFLAGSAGVWQNYFRKILANEARRGGEPPGLAILSAVQSGLIGLQKDITYAAIPDRATMIGALSGILVQTRKLVKGN